MSREPDLDHEIAAELPAAEVRRWVGYGGIELAGEARGEANDLSAAPVLLLHGGGQTRTAWGATTDALVARGHRVVAIDLRGHGESEWAPDGGYSIDAFAGDVIAVARALESPPIIVGASLGGIAAMIAQARAEVARALILVDIAPRIEEQGVTRIVAFMSAYPDGFASLEQAAEAIARYLPHRSRPSDPSGLRRVLRAGDDGRWRWHWDPRFLDIRRSARGDDDRDVLEASARHLRVPTLLVRGRRSDLLSPAGVDEFLQLVPHARFVDVADAGHMVAGDSNDAFVEAVVEFIAALDEDDDAGS